MSAASPDRVRGQGPVRVLVTGALGFLGRYVVEQHLARGDRVRALVRRPAPELARQGAEVVQGDLRDEQAVAAACAGIEIVQHTAAVPGIWGPWKHYYETNTLGTEYVLKGCLKHNVARLVFTSSPSVTFDGTDQRNVDESAPYPARWLCHYPHTKALAEQAVLAHNGRSHDDGQGTLLTCALRPHLIWGPRDQHLIPRLLARAKSGRLRRIGPGTNKIDMVYVENAAAAQLTAADRLVPGSPVCGQAYFITQCEPVNCWDWIDEILTLAGQPTIKKSISARAAWAIGAACEAIYTILRKTAEPPMTRFLAAQLSTDHYFNPARARDELGYRPLISIPEGMLRLRASWKSRPPNHS